MTLRKLIAAPVGNDSPALDQINGVMTPAMEIDDQTGIIYVGGKALTGGGTGTPGDGNGAVQFNDNGAFGGDANNQWSKTTKTQQIIGQLLVISPVGAGHWSVIGTGAPNNFVYVGSLGDGVNGDKVQIKAANNPTSSIDILSNGDQFISSSNGKLGLFGSKLQMGIAGVAGLPLEFQGTSSGLAQLGVADAAGTPNRINLPQVTGSLGMFLKTDGANPQQLVWAYLGTGLAVFANNAAAISGGLVAGQLYRTGADPDVVCVVH